MKAIMTFDEHFCDKNSLRENSDENEIICQGKNLKYEHRNKRFSEFQPKKNNGLIKSSEMFLFEKQIQHIVDKIKDDELEEELPVAKSFTEAEIGSILNGDLIDDEMKEIMKRVGNRGVIYTEISKFYWQVRGDILVRIE